jgi:hypothetical protein
LKTIRWAGLDPHRVRPWQEPTKCVFCGSTGPLTKEHVYSDWTRRFVPRTMKNFKSLRATAHLDRTDFVLVKRPGDVRNWQVKCVCGSICNNGWMRCLDERARPIMIPIITGKSTRINQDQQRILAAWATMKAMVAEFAESEYVTTHHSQRKRMMNKQLPPEKGWSVWIAHYVSQGSRVYWLANPFLLLPHDIAVRRPSRRATYYNGHATTQIIGQLLIHIIRSPMANLSTKWRFKQLPRGQMIFRIWPPTNYSITWPSGTIDDTAASHVADAVKEFMIEGERRHRATTAPSA